MQRVVKNQGLDFDQRDCDEWPRVFWFFHEKEKGKEPEKYAFSLPILSLYLVLKIA